MEEKEIKDQVQNETVEEVTVEEVKEEAQEEAVEEVKSAVDENIERLQRLMAEFDNYRKRTEKEKQNIYDLAVSTTVTELLGTVDNFERALKQETTDKSFYEGVSMIYRQLLTVLEKLNVTPIEDDTLEENIVVEELQKGYLYKEKVIRYSMVKVAN